MLKALTLVAILIAAPGVAAEKRYNPVNPDLPSFSLPLAGDRHTIIRAARRELESRGFTFTRSNLQAGVLATSAETRRFDPDGGLRTIGPRDLRCTGPEGGQPDLGAPGTTIRVAYNIHVPGGANRATIQAVVSVRGADGSPLDCASTGRLETELRGRITGRTQSFGS